MRWGASLLATAFVAAAVALVASGPATTTRAASDPFTVGCYDGPSATADVAVVAFKGHSGTTAEELCVDLWASESHSHAGVVACVLPSGGLGVFPNDALAGPDEACAALGASLPDEGPAYEGLSAETVRALDRTLAARYEATWSRGETCGDAVVLRALAIEALAEFDAARWRVVDESAGAGTCARPRVEALAGRVVLEGG